MKTAHIEKITNKLLGYNVNNAPSVELIEITDEVWQEALSINANAYENGKFIVKDFRTESEITEQELLSNINKANQYLKETDWVKDYKTRHDLGLELILEDSKKWSIIAKRAEYLEFLKGL